MTAAKTEADRWKQFYEELLGRFFRGAGDCEAQIIAEFDSYLPDKPPWKK